MYLTTHSLQCWCFADFCSLLAEWQWVAPGGEQPSQKQAIGEIDTWWLWCILVEHGEGTCQEHNHTRTPCLQGVIVVSSHHTHLVCTSVSDVAMNSVPITSFGSTHTHTHTSLCAVCSCVWVSPSPVQIHVMFPSCGFMQHVMLHSVRCMYKGSPSVSPH